MLKILSAFLAIFMLGTSVSANDLQIIYRDPLDNMPLIYNPAVVFRGSSPVEQRGIEYRKWLSASVKIEVSSSSGSGTIVYYDQTRGFAYVASCGHLWSGDMSFEEGQRRKIKCNIVTWYHNEEKLDTPKRYPAEVMFYSNHPGPDTSLIIFKPDWKPNYFPIAPVNYEIPAGKDVNSCGCDGGREVARYEVEIVGIQGQNLITRRNSPRPGRSGGGLMDDKYYIGTCWGTSDIDGSGIGYFTPLSKIHAIWIENKHAWLLNIPLPGGLAQELSIIDINNPQGKYPKDYVPIP